MLLLPFVLLLGSMAVFPAVAPRWWGKYYPWIALGLGAMTLSYYCFGLHAITAVQHTAHEYFSFIVLVGSLFVVSGGIEVGVRSRGTPSANVLFLLAGALAANVLGTTGAAMLLIRPWLRVNQTRLAPYHVVFFIFIVANVGGSLTPVGDPPLFLGYLQGIPFWWMAQNGWPMWVAGVGALLAMFYLIDRWHWSRLGDATRRMENNATAWKFAGGHNLVFLAIILGAVFLQHPVFLREGLMLAAAAASYFLTRKNIHQANGFDFHPAVELAILFAGVFATMMPALDWLNSHASSLLGARPSPGAFFWGTGILSSTLDNAPTYLGFLSALTGLTDGTTVVEVLGQHVPEVLGISIGAVFFGGATYIGNGPNFMVKAVAEQQGAHPPGFLAYVFKYTLPYLLPVLAAVWWLFFRG